jgi:hypothetical protein
MNFLGEIENITARLFGKFKRPGTLPDDFLRETAWAGDLLHEVRLSR